MFQRASEFVFGLISWKMWCHSTIAKSCIFCHSEVLPLSTGCRQSWEVLDETHSAMNSLDLPPTQDASGK